MSATMCGKRALLLTALVLLFVTWTKAVGFGGKPNYRPVFEAMDLHMNLMSREYYDLHYARIGMTAASVNRERLFNANFTLKKNLTKETWGSCTAFEKKANNDYSLIPVKLIAGRVCDLLEADQFIYKDLFTYSNLPKECPAPKGNYYIKDYKVDVSPLPPELPGERWKMDCSLQTSAVGRTIIKWTFYFFLNRSL